jgi:hypothetical protein
MFIFLKILNRCHNFQYFGQYIGIFSLKNCSLSFHLVEIEIRVGRPLMPIQMHRNDADPTGSGSTTLEGSKSDESNAKSVR